MSSFTLRERMNQKEQFGVLLLNILDYGYLLPSFTGLFSSPDFQEQFLMRVKTGPTEPFKGSFPFKAPPRERGLSQSARETETKETEIQTPKNH